MLVQPWSSSELPFRKSTPSDAMKDVYQSGKEACYLADQK